MIPSVVVPEVKPGPDSEELYKLYREWRLRKEDEAPPIENIRFQHSPNWRNETWVSMEAARQWHTGKYPVWTVVAVLYGIANVSMYIIRFR